MMAAVSLARRRSLVITRSAGKPVNSERSELRLGAAGLGELGVRLALETGLGVVGGLAVADQNEACG